MKNTNHTLKIAALSATLFCSTIVLPMADDVTGKRNDLKEKPAEGVFYKPALSFSFGKKEVSMFEVKPFQMLARQPACIDVTEAIESVGNSNGGVAATIELGILMFTACYEGFIFVHRNRRETRRIQLEKNIEGKFSNSNEV